MTANKDLNVIVSTRLTEREYSAIQNLIKGRKRKRSALIRYLIQKGLQEVDRLQSHLNQKNSASRL